MARRRTLTGNPLLLASAGVFLAVGCGGSGRGPLVTGNLVPPPMVEGRVCVDTTPSDALVLIDGTQTSERCSDVSNFNAAVTVEVSAAGFIPKSQDVTYSGGETVELTVVLDEAELQKKPPHRPPQPVGNLMPPPDLEELQK